MWYGVDFGDANVGVVLTVQRWNGGGWATYSQGGIGDTDGNGSLRYDTSAPSDDGDYRATATVGGVETVNNTQFEVHSAPGCP
jgi:hypothetical protein